MTRCASLRGLVADVDVAARRAAQNAAELEHVCGQTGTAPLSTINAWSNMDCTAYWLRGSAQQRRRSSRVGEWEISGSGSDWRSAH
jgi:hypothetical protein